MTLTVGQTRNKLLSSVYTSEPVNMVIEVGDAKRLVNASPTDEDALIEAMIRTAMGIVEDGTHRTLITRSLDTTWISRTLPLRVLRPPVLTLVSLKTEYQGTETDDTAATANAYLFDKNGMRPKVAFNDDGEFVQSNIQTVKISTTNGYGPLATDVPDQLIHAVRYLVSELYDQRDGFIQGTIMETPNNAQTIMDFWEVPNG